MKILFQILFLLITFSAAAQKQFVVDPNAELREITGSFNSIKVSSGIHVFLSQGESEAIAISASEDKYKEELKTEISNGELHIFYSGDRNYWGKDQRLNVYVSYKNIGQLTVTGASEVVLAGTMKVPILNLQLSSASELKGGLTVNELNIKLSGASTIKLTGTTQIANIESSGASDIKAYGLTAEICNVKVSGASDVNISVSKEISANASGASEVYYKGPGELKVKQTSGSSSVARVE